MKEAFKEGVLAAQKQEWLNALGYFEEVRRAVPLAPELLFNLGLTEEALPGRELRASGWFKAYLAVVPEGPNTRSVEDTCRTLEKEVNQRVTTLLRQAGQVAGRFPENEARNRNLLRVITAQGRTGNFVDAEEIVYQIEAGVYRDSAYEQIARLMAEAGNITGARKNLGLCNPKNCNKHEVLMAIARVQAREGDLQGMTSSLREDREWINQYGQNKPVQYKELTSTQTRLTEEAAAAKSPAPKTVSPGPPKPSPEDQKRKAEAITRFIETRLDKPYFLNPEGYFRFLDSQSNPREKFEALIEAAIKIDGALKDLQKLAQQP